MDLPKMSTEKPKQVGNTNSDDAICPNHLKQDFGQSKPNLVWASDITYIKVNSYFAYLCVIMDLFSRKVISWELSTSATADTVINAFNKAYERRGKPQGLMFHSDRGTQYTAFAFRQTLDKAGVVQSFSKKGYPYDNAVCESFFKFLKREEVNRKKYHTLQELHTSLFEYIESFYNNKRPHRALGMLTPNEVEAHYWEQA